MRSRLQVLLAGLLSAALTALVVAGCGGSGDGTGDSGGGSSQGSERPAGKVPAGFMGTAFDGPLLDPEAVDAEHEVRVMAESGVETLRLAIDWNRAQPVASLDELPAAFRKPFEDKDEHVAVVEGVPTVFDPMDRAIELAAKREMKILPHAIRTPEWARVEPDKPNSPPKDPQTYANFMAALVERYGPDGTFWKAHPDLPKQAITDWQIWNEPDQPDRYWSVQPFAPEYVKLVAASRKAIKAVDPDARIVLAGLVGESWKHLQQVYDQPGARETFDVVAIHPYTEKISNVMKILDLSRDVMERNGDADKPMMVTELTWPSAKGKVETYGYEATEAGQARKLAEIYPLLAANHKRLKLENALWYTWLTTDKGTEDPFHYAGLRRLEGHRAVPKPAFHAYVKAARDLEGCAKTDVATRCK
jgi:hypothetical protein